MPVSSTGSGATLRHRAVRLVARLRTRPCPPRLSRPAQVRVLVEVLNEALAAQQQADAAVASCGEPGPLSGQAARDCGHANSAFLHLQARLRGLPLTDPDLVRAQAYAGRLLAYDQWMVHQSLNLAFTVHPDARTEAARLQLNGLGRPADDLRRLRDTLKPEERTA
ncbi:hypothetical protein ACFYO2_28795 [Streptomyces sp. NPDC006602]|uniref:hypothetical protein n=1 Tax=Streptomyces sp. NPDC006602 TaxID=3364751 RepID=UPI0036CD13AD